MPNDEQDNAGIRVPPPLLYLAPLVSGLLLDRRYHGPFLPRGMARTLGWALLSGGVVLAGWFLRTMRSNDTSIRTDKPVSSLATGGPFRYTRNPGYLSHRGGQARRRVLHRRALEVLEEEGGAPAPQLARHALAGGIAEPAFRYSMAAGDQAMEVFAAHDAIEHYERARDLLAEDEVPTGRRQPTEPSVLELEHLYTQLGRAYEIAYEWGKARAAYETILTFAREVGEARLERSPSTTWWSSPSLSRRPTSRGLRGSWRRLEGWPRRQA